MTDTENTEKAKPAAKAHEPEPRTWPLARLTSDEGARLTGVEPHILAGALTLAPANRVNFSEQDVADLVDEFLTREVPNPEMEDGER